MRIVKVLWQLNLDKKNAKVKCLRTSIYSSGNLGVIHILEERCS